MIINKKLYQTLKSLAKKAIPIYGSRVAALETQYRYWPYLGIALHKIDNEIIELAEFKTCLNTARKDKKLMRLQGKLVGTTLSMSVIENESGCI